MKYTLLGTLAAVAAAAGLSAFGFAITAAAQDDKQATHAELVQRCAEAAIEAQLKGMKTSLRLSADQEKLWGVFESAVKDGQNARLLALQKEQSDKLSPMDRLTARRTASRGAGQISRKLSRRPSRCTRASEMSRNTSSSRLDARWCASAGAL